MKKVLYFLLITLLIALGIRLYPTLVSNMPFSTDAWPLIRNTELLIQNTPTPITSAIFDGYNNYWPGCQLFGAVCSLVLALPTATAMALGIPIAAALTIPIFYLLVKKITKNTQVSLVAAFLLATAFPYALFTAGVTKETFAAPLLITLILLFLLKHDKKTLLLFSIVAVALVLSHHLTAFMAAGIVVSLSVASLLTKKASTEQVNSTKSNILFSTLLFCIVVLYFGLFAFPALKLSLTVSDLLSVGAYQLFLTSVLIYLVYIAKNYSAIRATLNCILGFTIIFTLMFLTTKIPLMPSAPTLPLYYFLYVIPFMVGLPLVIFGLNELYQKSSYNLIPLFWVLPAAAFACYAVFSNAAGGVGFAYRSINFMLPPFLILVAVGLYKLQNNRRTRGTRTAAALFAAAMILCMGFMGSYSVYAAVSLQEPFLGYFWRYEPSEYQASQWINAVDNNQTVAGDLKVSYLLNGYFNQDVAVLDGLRYLEGDGSAPPVLYVYRQMSSNGYVLYEGSPVVLPQNWTDQLSGCDLIYGNTEVTIYAKR